MSRLLEIMARLRDPQQGCPWDKQQTFETILPFTLEEVYEVVDAIERGDMAELKAELGDLLFQIVFYAQLAREQGLFEFADIVAGIADKLEQRHPHVFGSDEIKDAAAQSHAWEKHKEQERAHKAASEARPVSVLDNIPVALPGLMRAAKLQRRVARVGFEWPDIMPVLDKIEEEIGEIREALANGGKRDEMQHEIGDLMFACVNLARHADIDPEVALRSINRRFERRFRRVEVLASERGRPLPEMSLIEMNELWEQAKVEEVLRKQAKSEGTKGT
ncbi:MAG: nucleoside triphosphate pyrophosphohydrolase [Pseudomonadota bacterium]|nr:nucleoside triphosphate pyrophosphohydrolase [Pseudomonadota bacterium]